MDSIYYDYEDDSLDQEEGIDQEYEIEYEQETLTELYEHCLKPTLFNAAEHFIPLLGAAFLYRIIAHCNFIPKKLVHGCAIIMGYSILHHYVPESLYLQTIFITASYICLQLPKQCQNGIGVFIPSIFIILYCELRLDPVSWHKIRGVVMLAVMKQISIAIDQNDSTEKSPTFLEYIGYLVCPITSIFGPWISFKNYALIHREALNPRWMFTTIGYFTLGFVFLGVSNCISSWVIPDYFGEWLIAYRDASSFRMSHYFVSYVATSLLLLGGYPNTSVTITKPLEIEFPRSLVQVVISWNIPMHYWLKIYIFRPGRRQLGKFGGILLTYLASSLLHGLNFQLSAVLFSLGFYTYVEYQLRAILSSTFDACISSKKCPKDQCQHSKKLSNCWWVVLVNFAFSALAIFHLTYLGLMFDISETQETGYSYSHTIEKWSELGFASHWVALATYCAYFLIR